MDWESQRPSAPSTPTSVSSHSTSGTNSSKEKIPPYKPLNPSPTISALSKISNDELFRKGPDEILRILRLVESDYKNILSEHSSITKDINRRIQIFVLEARGLKEINQKLQDDNQELRDLCCFLDDDRQRSRKLAREWQRFGRYTASVMHSEVAAYQEKLHQLEERQSELLSDNMELKELCLFLDHERSQQMSGDRDDGDGSSNGTVPGHEEIGQSHGDSDGQITPTPTPTPSQQGNEASTAYVRQLELKIQRLEEEKKQLAQRVERNGADGFHPADQNGSSRHFDTNLDQPGHAGEGRQGNASAGRDRVTPTFSMNKPEAVVHAMKRAAKKCVQVLQVHEQLERPRDPVGTEDLGDTEKAIVREMCNVVWRKLGDVGEYPPHTAAGATFPPASNPPAQPMYRPQSAAGNPHSTSSRAPPKSQLPSHSVPTSPTGPGHPHSSRGNHRQTPTNMDDSSAGPSSLEQVSPPGGGGGYANERRSQLPAGQRSGTGHSSGQGQSGQPSRGREGYGQTGGGGGMMNYSPGDGGREQGPRQRVGGGRDDFQGQKGSRVPSGPSYSQPPASVATERPRYSQPPPYSSAKAMSTAVPSSRSGPNPSHYHPPVIPSQQIPQPHHQDPPPSRSSQQPAPPRYQQRTHPLHASQGQQPQSQSQSHHPFTRSASASATYYVSHPTSAPKSHSSSALLPPHLHPSVSSSVPGASYLYAQRGGGSGAGGGGAQHPQFQSHPGGGGEQGGQRSGVEQGRTEWRQTYLDE